ncbi:MAG: NAD(P)/FAD-dependent oxidoreductase [Chloroflexi bacterium]|nr:NAD(P)/FAD-dependent oxidoreductase [Chloroflexota bacterium]MCI0575069.1 NAD(P)/FAD-dependent oxidoreductase [Chloroflexota bacterium]MCI0643595.1 NAD(P)/FAD-dependent oxidoreductase [Chloroflexota bacterium]MCI0726217.1 NAD(P)/FAD-dependent oxidoreductase [Chloroflexota bacterium]
MKRVLILGGGFGGLATAHTLRTLRPDDEVVLVDRATHFMVGFRKIWDLLGLSPQPAVHGRLADLEQFGIQVIHGAVTKLDPDGRAAEVGGRRLEADALVVALGASLGTDRIPGFSHYALNVYDPRAIARNREALQNFSGGRVLLGVFGLPYKCPPAPYEIALLVQEFFAGRGVAATMEVFTPQPSSMPILGQAGCLVIEGRLMARGITFLPNHTATAVEEGEVVFTTGRRPYDLLLGIPPHRCPAVIVESGLTDGGAWVSVNPRTLETRFPGVYAVGDVTQVLMANDKPLPKAGVFAESQGRVVAHRIAAAFEGRPPDVTFEGQGGCFLEFGHGEAAMIEGHFMAEPAPQVRLTEASKEYLDQKQAFEQERLRSWFPQDDN